MNGLLDDLRHALRLYSRTPLQSGTAVIMVALAMAFSTAFFSLYNDLVMSPPGGIDRADRVASIGLTDDERFHNHFHGEFRADIADKVGAIDSVIGAQYQAQWLVELGGETLEADLATAGAGLFSDLGVTIARGRGFEEEDFSAEGAPVAVLSHAFWEQAFDADPEIIGREIRLDEHDAPQGSQEPEDAYFRIVGVSAPEFEGVHRGEVADLWLPMHSFATKVWGVPEGYTDMVPLQSIVRFAEGRDLKEAASELEARSEELREAHPDVMRGNRLKLHSALTNDPHAHDDAVRQVSVFAGSGLLVALIAAANLSLFLLARAPERRPEMALRRAVGARPRRLIRQLLTESSLLVVLGALLGLVMVLWLGLGLRELPIFEGVAWQQESVMDWRVLGFVLTLAALLAAAVGLAPALDLSGSSISARSRQGRGGTGWTRRLLAAGQVSVAAVVLAMAALFAQATLQAEAGAQGYEPEGVLALEGMFAGEGQFHPDSDDTRAMRAAMQDRLEGLPGVEQIGFGPIPLVRPPDSRAIEPVDGREEEFTARGFNATVDWLEILGAQLLRGNFPDPDDGETATVTREFAQVAFGEVDVVGEEFDADAGQGIMDADSIRYRIEGVIEDLPLSHPAERPQPAVILNGVGPMDGMLPVLIDGQADHQQLKDEASEPWADGNPPMEPESVTSLDSAFHEALAPDRSRALLSGAAGLLVLILASLGFYGTLRFMVEARRFEYALRAALGASPAVLKRQVMARGLGLGLPGLAVGLVLAALALIWLRETLELYMVSLWPPLLGCTLVLGAALLLAVWLPARRVAGMDPAAALRDE